MNYFSIDYLVIYAFIAISLTIGIRAGRGIKDVREYILANRNFSKWALSFSYVTTSIAGAGILATAAKTYTEWVITGVALVLTFVMYVITGIFIIPKIAHFKNCLTLGDVIATMYGEKSNLVGGIVGSLIVICRSCMDMIVLGIFSKILLDLNGSWVIVVGGLILGAYAAYGGIKSIVTTDIFQFLITIGILPMTIYIVLNAAGGIGTVFNQVTSAELPFVRNENFSYYLTYFLVWNFFPLGILTNPATMQRLLVAKSGRELKEQSLLAAVFSLLFKIAIMLIGLAGYVLYPTVPDSILVAHLIKVLMPIGAKGLAIVSFLAATMSSMTSCFHAAGFTIVHDIIKPICKKINVRINELIYIRWTTILITIIAITISLTKTNVYQLYIIPFGLCGPLLIFPVLSGILGFKPDKQSFYYPVIATIITFSLCKWVLSIGQDDYTVILSMTANGVTFFTTHLIKNKGVTIINRAAGKEMLWRPKKKSFISSLKQIISTPNRIIQHAQRQAEQCGNPYVPFGILLTIHYVVPYSLWTNIPIEYHHTMLMLRVVGGFLCGLLIVNEKLPKAVAPYLPIFWYFTILFCIPFTNTLMHLLSNGSMEWLLSLMSLFMLLYIILDWMSALIIGILGIALAEIYFRVMTGKLAFPLLEYINKYQLIYQIAFGCVLLITFLRKKQMVFNRLTTQRDYFKYIQEDAGSRLVETLKYREELLKELDAQQIAIFDDVTAAYIKQAIYRVTDYLRLDVKTIILDKFLEKVEDIMGLQDFTAYPEVYIQRLTKIKEIQADENKLYQVLANSISYIHEHNLQNNSIRIVLEESLIGYMIAHMKDYTKKIEALKITITTEDTLPIRKDIYMIDSNQVSTCLHHDHKTKQLPLVENTRIIDAHYGYIDAESPHTHTYVIPVNLRKIRGKVMELLTEPPQANEDELNHPLAIELERKLFDKLEGLPIDLGVIQKALIIIKKYHGGVKRRSGEPFFTHPMAVALILLEQIQDQDAVVGALLHDTVEDTSLSIAQIKVLFGETVAFIVNKVTNLEDNFRRINLDDHENLHQLTDCEDERVALVKLSDRMHNMRTIQFHPSLTKQKSIANETLNFFVPMAKQLNRISMAEELESLCVEVLEKEE